MTRGFAPMCVRTQCTLTFSALPRGTWGLTTPPAGSARATRSWRLEQSGSSGSQVGEACRDRRRPSLTYGSVATGMPPAQFNEARQVARKVGHGKPYRRCLDLDFMFEDAGTDPGRRGATCALLMWRRCAWVERWVPALWMTTTLLAASVKLGDLDVGAWTHLRCRGIDDAVRVAVLFGRGVTESCAPRFMTRAADGLGNAR